MTNTVILETGRLERHPSFPDGMPAIIAEPIPVGYCEVCAWLAGEIRKADARNDWSRVADHARTAIGHVATQHPSYGIHNIGDGDVRETRQTYNGGAS